MASFTPILHLPEVAPNQNQKEDTINTALAILESAMNNVKTYTLAGVGPLNLTEDDYTRYFLHSFSGQTVAATVSVPAGQPRWFAVENAGSFPITFSCYGYALTNLTLEVPAGHIALVVSNGEDLRTVVPQDGMGLLQDLSDVQGTPTNGQLLRYNGTFSKWEPWTLTQAFTALTDAPHSYTGAGGMIVAVKEDSSGLEFITSAANINSFVDLDDTPSSYNSAGGRFVKVSSGASGLVFETLKFTDATDTPANYSGAANKFLRVNGAGDAVVFADGGSFLELSDTPDDYTGNEGKFVSVKADGTGLEFNSGTGGPDRFITLLDTPGTYTGQALKNVRVNAAADALEFFNETFLSLADTPNSYAAQGGKLFRVNPGGTGMGFYTLSFDELDNVDNPESNAWLRWNGDGTQVVYDFPTFLGLDDTPNAYTGNEGKFVYVKGDGSGLGFTATSANLSYLELTDTTDATYAGKTGMSPIVTLVGAVPQLTLGFQSFVTLVGGPGGFTGQAGKVVAVKGDESGLEYADPPASTLDGLTDVVITDPQDGQGLVYNAILGWVNEDLPDAGGGTGVPSNGSHLYWRLLLHTTDGDTTQFGIQEIEFKRTKTGADLATGGVASASTEEAGQPASGAFDDEIAGAWFSTSAADGQWIKYEFTAPAEVRYLTIMGSQSRTTTSPAAFSVQWSDDDAIWTTAWEVTGQTGWAASQIREFHAPLDLFFTDLADVPQSYIGQALKSVRVNAASTALEFYTPVAGPTSLAALTDVNIPTPTDRQVLSFDAIANEWVALTLSIPDQLPSFRGEWSGSGEMITINSEAGFPSELTPDAAGFTVVTTQPDTTAGTLQAIKTRPLGISESCYLEQTVDFVSDTPLKVRYKVSSESGFDFFRVLVDGVSVFQDSGLSGVYEEFSTTLTGVHTIRYQYIKDTSGASGDDCTYISQITYKQVLANPFVYSDTVTYGGVTYFCLVDGTTEEPGTGSEWIAFSSGGGGGTPALSDLTDVDLSSTPTEGQVLTYNEGLGKWIAATPTGGSSEPVSPHGAHPYWRILVNATDGGANAEIGDLNFQPVIGGGYLSIDTGYGDASSTNGGHGAADGLDQDDSTYWQAATATAEWLKYHIDPGNTVMSVMLTAPTTSLDLTNMPADFDVQYSDDESMWTTAWNVSGATDWTSGEQREFIDPGVTYPTPMPAFTDLTDTPDSYSGEAGRMVRVTDAEDGLEFSDIASDFGVFVAGKPLNSEKVVRFIVATPFIVLTGTHQGSSDVASTASKVFSFTKNGTEFLTATFAAAGTVPTFSANVETTFAAGDVLAITAPAVADTSLADISFTLKGRR